MNELIEPFVLEARELIEAATDDLIELDRDPSNAARIESVFRSFHTLKGSAGLLDLHPMALALHAAEDLLVAIRSGRVALTGAIVDGCLGALDRVAGWVTAVEAAGTMPPEAAAQAEDLARALRDFMPEADGSGPPPASDGAPGWAEALLARTAPSGIAAAVFTAIRYVPLADCVLNGDDPLAIVARVPRLEAVEIRAREPWPDPDRLDPFACNLVITGLSASPREEVATVFRLVADQVTLTEIRRASPPAAPAGLGDLARTILAEQVALLSAEHRAAIRAGVERSALLSAGHVLRREGLHDRAQVLLDAADTATQDPLALLRDALDPPAAPAPDPDRSAGAGQAGARHLRVDAERLDAVAGLASELTIARNTLGHLVAQLEAGVRDENLLQRLRESDAALGRLAGDLHRSVMGIRMVPLAGVFRRFARPVRDLAAQLGKEVAFEVSGEETEADRAIADSLFELLLHVLRNAVDHGLEAPSERAKTGKPPQGRLGLSARLERDRILVTVSDDGRGIDPATIRRIALARGLVDAEAAVALSDEDAIDLIFAPGFSTAAAVTDVSGRGIGMDAVRTGAQRLGGRVEVESRPGEGTTIRFSLPQTTTLTPLMSVRAGGEAWGIPLQAVIELRRIDPGRIAAVKSGYAVAWRGRTIPVVSLAERLAGGAREGAERERDMLVVGVAGEPAGLLVDGVAGRIDALVRPLGVFSDLPGLAGTTVLGDGRILLVLDLDEVLA